MESNSYGTIYILKTIVYKFNFLKNKLPRNNWIIIYIALLVISFEGINTKNIAEFSTELLQI